MGVSAKGILKDNKEIFLPLGGLLVLVLIIILSTGSGMELFSPLDTLENKRFIEAEDVLEEGLDYAAIIKTSQGEIEIDLFEDEVSVSVNNFVFLSAQRFYEKLTFHKVMKDFIIQTGDPLADSTGDAGYTYTDIITDRRVESYSVVMANAGDKTSNGSQIFIVCEGADTSSLQGKYTVIGEVTSGFVVVDAIGEATVDENYKPSSDITIQSIQILED